MIPDGLQWALEGGRGVQTDAGSGPARGRRLAHLVLPTGRVLLGCPGSPLINEPGPDGPSVAPGCYPVLASVVDTPAGYRDPAFVGARFEDAPPLAWEEVGAFFTDSG